MSGKGQGMSKNKANKKWDRSGHSKVKGNPTKPDGKNTKKNVRNDKEVTRPILPENPTYLLPEEIPNEPLDRGKDFATLICSPSFKGTQFMLKSEKKWSINVSQYSEMFELNIAALNAGISCIPFNECFELDKDYFTNDQLTMINNTVDRAKTNYQEFLKNINVTTKDNSNKNTESLNVENTEESHQSSVSNESHAENLEDELDFLLSLNEPVDQIPHKSVPDIALNNVDVTASKIRKQSTKTKTIDLEKWLDTILGD